MISISSLSSNKDIKGTEHTDSQSRIQSPLVFWSAGRARRDSGEFEKKNFFLLAAP